MNISLEQLQDEARRTGFRAEILEKVLSLMAMLDGLRSHPYLKGRLALKGGTALNLFLFDIPRLSVDIDLNYIGAVERDTMLSEKPNIDRALKAVFQRENTTVTRAPTEHAGGKWRLRYESALGGGGNIEVDLNFMYRVPLWPVQQRDSRSIGAFRATAIPVLDLHELAAGKLTALFARRASRDLFDAHMLLTRESLDTARLRTAFVALGGMNRKDWRTIRLEDIGLETNEIRDQLLPVLRTAGQPGSKGPDEWGKTLVDECRTALSCLLPFTEPEKEFLDRLLDHGEISPSLITCDAALSERLARHPLLEWKALNVRRRRKNA